MNFRLLNMLKAYNYKVEDMKRLVSDRVYRAVFENDWDTDKEHWKKVYEYSKYKLGKRKFEEFISDIVRGWIPEFYSVEKLKDSNRHACVDAVELVDGKRDILSNGVSNSSDIAIYGLFNTVRLDICADSSGYIDRNKRMDLRLTKLQKMKQYSRNGDEVVIYVHDTKNRRVCWLRLHPNVFESLATARIDQHNLYQESCTIGMHDINWVSMDESIDYSLKHAYNEIRCLSQNPYRHVA